MTISPIFTAPPTEGLDEAQQAVFAALAELGIPFERRHRVIGLEDSSAGVVSIKLAGFSCVGISGGNIEAAGVGDMCDYKIDDLMQMLDIIL